jgi:hypothetical protein
MTISFCFAFGFCSSGFLIRVRQDPQFKYMATAAGGIAASQPAHRPAQKPSSYG